MGGMFTVLKVREDLASGDYKDPGPYRKSVGHGRPCRLERRRTAATATKPTPFSGDGDARHGYARHEGTSAQSLGAKSNLHGIGSKRKLKGETRALIPSSPRSYPEPSV